jgi:type IV secretion system protein VirB10
MQESVKPDGEEREGAAALDRAMSKVASRSPARRLWIPVGGGALLLLLLLVIHASSSEGRSNENGPDRTVGSHRADPPRLDLPPELDPSRSARGSAESGDPTVEPMAQQLAYDLQRQALAEAERRRKVAAERRRSPMVLFDEGGRPTVSPVESGARASRRASERASASAIDDADLGREERFARRAGREAVETVRATRIESPSTLVPQGTLISGVLETAIQSDLPGLIRAQVSAPVPAFDGTLAIPRGSRLIGRYQSGLVRGQTRVFVVWTRCLRPDGVSIELGSPGADSLGRAGIAGEIDTHFFEIFGASVVLSLIDGGLGIAAAKAQDNDNSTIVSSGGDDLSRAAEIALKNRIDIPPTIRIASGTPIQVFVAKDLDFAGAPAASE